MGGRKPPSKRCKPAYREIQQTAREKLTQTGGHIAWAASSGGAAHEYCSQYLVQYIKEVLGKLSKNKLTGGGLETSQRTETIEAMEGAQAVN